MLNRDRKFGPISRDAAGPWSATGPGPSQSTAPVLAPAAEGETDSLSTAQKSMLKWEKEETLGELATVAPVLYTNVNFPNLKEEYPGGWGLTHPFNASVRSDAPVFYNG